MSNNTLFPQKFQLFFDSVYNSKVYTGKYARLNLSSLKICNSDFLVLSSIAFLANFKTHFAFMKKQKGYLARKLGWKTYDRSLKRLESRRYITDYKNDIIDYKVGRKARPINIHIFHLSAEKETALWIRFIIYLASCRVSWNKIKTDEIQRRLRIDRNTASLFAKWLVKNYSNYSKNLLRKKIFYSTRPSWFEYVDKHCNSINCPKTAKQRIFSDFVPINLDSYNKDYLNKLTCTSGGEGDTMPIFDILRNVLKIPLKKPIDNQEKNSQKGESQKLSCQHFTVPELEKCELEKSICYRPQFLDKFFKFVDNVT